VVNRKIQKRVTRKNKIEQKPLLLLNKIRVTHFLRLTANRAKGASMQIGKSRITEIGKLHSEIIGHLKTSLAKAVRIGELLTEQKGSLKHGQFTPWIESNLPFTDRTAQNYMRCYRERDRLKTETVSDLKSAYRVLSVSKQNDDLNWFEGLLHCWANCVNCAKEEYQCSWREAFELVYGSIKNDDLGSQLTLNDLMTYHVYFFDIVSDDCVPRSKSYIKPTDMNITVDGIIDAYWDRHRQK
jgi:hypothetical protein